VAPDLRGHGASEQPEDEASYSLGRFAADLTALTEALGWQQFVLLGHSMGGMIAQQLVLSSPARVRGLVLMDTTHGPVDWIEPETFALGASMVRARGMRALMELQQSMRENDPLVTPAFMRLLRERPGYEEFCDNKLLASSPAMWQAMAPALLAQTDRLERLARVRVPTLVIVGEQDTPFVAHSERMAKTIPGARLVIVPEAGHSPQFENAGVWWEAITAFLDDIERVG
jgi:pimeloyl-ACP methyl ester carboxylesterase